MIRLSMQDADTIRIDAGPLEASLVKAVPGTRAHPRGEPPYWTVNATLYHGVVMRNIFGERMEYDDEVKAFFVEQRRLEKARKNVPDKGIDERLYPYQHIGAHRLMLGPTMLFDGTGVGKNVQTLSALNALGPEALPALVVCSRTMKLEFREDTKVWGPEANVYVVTGSAKQRKDVLAAAVRDDRALVVINWEAVRNYSMMASYPGLRRAEKYTQPKELNQIPFRTVIVDEAHRMKDPKSVQTLCVKACAQDAKWRWALTATPTNGDYDEMWSVLNFVAPREATSRTAFIDRYVYCLPGYNGRQEPLFLRPENEEELQWWLDQYRLRRLPHELPELAEKMPFLRAKKILVELTDKQKSAYKSMAKDYMARLGDSVLMEPDPLVRVGRLRYFASAMPVLSPEGEIVDLEAPSNKVDAMLELLANEENRPAVVFAESPALLKLAKSVADDKGYSTGILIGESSDKERQQTIRLFQDGSKDVMFVNAAGGESITLTAGASEIFLQTPRSLIMYEQMSGRVPRIGNNRPFVIAYHLVSEGTNDEEVYDTIVERKGRAAAMTGDNAKRRIYGSLVA